MVLVYISFRGKGRQDIKRKLSVFLQYFIFPFIENQQSMPGVDELPALIDIRAFYIPIGLLYIGKEMGNGGESLKSSLSLESIYK